MTSLCDLRETKYSNVDGVGFFVVKVSIWSISVNFHIVDSAKLNFPVGATVIIIFLWSRGSKFNLQFVTPVHPYMSQGLCRNPVSLDLTLRRSQWHTSTLEEGEGQNGRGPGRSFRQLGMSLLKLLPLTELSMCLTGASGGLKGFSGWSFVASSLCWQRIWPSSRTTNGKIFQSSPQLKLQVRSNSNE